MQIVVSLSAPKEFPARRAVVTDEHKFRTGFNHEISERAEVTVASDEDKSPPTVTLQ